MTMREFKIFIFIGLILIQLWNISAIIKQYLKDRPDYKAIKVNAYGLIFTGIILLVCILVSTLYSLIVIYNHD